MPTLRERLQVLGDESRLLHGLLTVPMLRPISAHDAPARLVHEVSKCPTM